MISARTLIAAAALIWYSGAFFVTAKGIALTHAAHILQPTEFPWHWLSLGLGVVTGFIKARFVFFQSSRRTISRLSQLQRRRWWNAYPLWFYPLLGLMILSGRLMAYWAGQDYAKVCVVIVAYLAIGTGLGLGGRPFFNDKIIRRATR